MKQSKINTTVHMWHLAFFFSSRSTKISSHWFIYIWNKWYVCMYSLLQHLWSLK